jgi:lysine-ketoglutarate reductase/saccharopine dehydrogenase-like protein (TIGR00300 family)
MSSNAIIMPFQEIVEAEGHLIDSHIMEQIFDSVVEFEGRFEVQHFYIGRTNSDPSRLRLKIEAPTPEQMSKMLTQLHGMGCNPVDGGDAELRVVERDCCAPEDFYSTTNHRTMVRLNNVWFEVQNQRMDATIVLENGYAICRRLRDLKAGDQVVTGMRGIRGIPESKERDRMHFAFMSSEVSSERQVETAVRQTAALMRQAKLDGKKIVAVAGPVVIHTGGAPHLVKLIRNGWIQALLAGNALGVHDIESALLGTSLGVRTADGRLEEHGHRNHMRAINAIYHAGGIRQAVESGKLQSGVMYECVKSDIPFVLAGSLRDDGPLPDTITDMNAAQDAYA